MSVTEKKKRVSKKTEPVNAEEVKDLSAFFSGIQKKPVEVIEESTSNVTKPMSLFDHCNKVKAGKLYWDSISDADRKSWGSFMIIRTLSMDPDVLPILNVLQKLNRKCTSNRNMCNLLTNLYKQVGSTRYHPYIKATTESRYSYPDDLLEVLCDYWEISKREACTYADTIDEDQIIKILIKYGKDDKEIKKMLKK